MTDHFCLSQGLDFLTNSKYITNYKKIEGFDTQTIPAVVSDFTSAVDNYASSNTSLVNKTSKFIDNISSQSDTYKNTIIKMKNGRRGYVTDKNIFKYIASDSILAAINKSCPTTVVNVNFESKKYLDVGEYLGTTPDFLVGKPMTATSLCTTSEINIQINGHVDTDSLTQTWEGCYNQVGDFFNQQVDLTGGYAANTVRRCAIRAADVGSSTFYIGQDGSSNYTCFTSKQDLTTEHIKSNMNAGLNKKTSLVVHSAVLTGTNRFCAGIMNNGQIAVGTVPSGTVVNFGSSVSNPVVMTRITNGVAVPVGGIGNCDPVYGSKIEVVGASFGRNCNPPLADNNWLSVINSRINNTLPYQSVKILAAGDTDPSGTCIKNFSALYRCTPETTDKIVNVVSGSSDYAIFDCSDNYGRCTAAVLTLSDTGNLTLTNGTNPNPLWQSNTSAVGIAILGNKAINGKNYLRTGEVLFQDEFIGSPSGNCILLCEKIGNRCSLSIVYYLWGCKAPGGVASASTGASGHIADGSGFRATYSINDPNKDKSLNGKVIHINSDMERMTYPDSMLSLSTKYIDAGNYAQSGPIITTISNSDLSGCKTECSAINNCYGFIHYETAQKCELKKKEDLFPSKLTRILSTDAKMFIRKYKIDNPNNSCSGVILNQYETGDSATKIPQGDNMSSSTKCMLGWAISDENDDVIEKETDVYKATNKMIKDYDVLSAKNSKLKTDLEKIYKNINKNFSAYDKLDNDDNSKLDVDNMNAMISESNIENIRQNMNYMAWTALATIAIFTIIKASR